MVLSTLIMRASDGLPLSASVDDGQENLSEQKKQCKLVTQKLSANSADRASIESGNYVIHYLMKDGIVYYCISESSYPRKLAFSYLDELDREFQKSHGQEALKEGCDPTSLWSSTRSCRRPSGCTRTLEQPTTSTSSTRSCRT